MGNWTTLLLNDKENLLLALLLLSLIEYITNCFLWFLYKRKNSKREKEIIIVKKLSILLLIVIANVMDCLVFRNNFSVGIIVIAFYIYHTGMAILNNVRRLEVPLPDILVRVLKLLSGE